MKDLFDPINIKGLQAVNRFVFPPIKTAYGTPTGEVTAKQIRFYEQVAHNGPGIIIVEPVAVTANGREHPKQLCVHLDSSVDELKKITETIHTQGRKACLHLNHAGAAVNPKASGGPPKAPSALTCPSTGLQAEALQQPEIEAIIAGYGRAAEKAEAAGFDLLEIQGGHGYLLSQFLNTKINQREDAYGRDRLLFAREVLSAALTGAPSLPFIIRISGNEMSPEFGIEPEDMLPFLQLAEEAGAGAVHVGMGSSCFSPPWYFQHGALPEEPQRKALAWVKSRTELPIIAAGRMGSKNKAADWLQQGLADLLALGRPLIADPDLIAKWEGEDEPSVRSCGYCLQGCLHRVKNGQPLGCNVNPEIGRPAQEPAQTPRKVFVVGGGPAGMSAALYLTRRGHQVCLAEKDPELGGQFNLAWQAPGKERMRGALDHLRHAVFTEVDQVHFGQKADAGLIREFGPDLLVWAAGAMQSIPEIDGLKTQNTMTSLEFFRGDRSVGGPRVLVIGAGRTGLEVAEKLGQEGYDVVATKRTDPLGSMMEMISRKLILMRLEQMETVSLMPHTTVRSFQADGVQVEQDGRTQLLPAFQTVILCSGMRTAPGPDADLREQVDRVEVIGDAAEVQDIFSAIQAGYELAGNS